MVQVKLFFIAVAVIFFMDMLWLGIIAKPLYFQQYAQWLRLDGGQLMPVWWAAGLVYLFLALAIVIFVLPLAAGSLVHALLFGALIGAVIYGVYDFTCLSVFKDFPVAMAFYDWLWGMVLCGVGALVTAYAARFV